MHLLSVDDDDVVTDIEVRRERRLVLAANDSRDLGREPAKRQSLGVDDVPATLDLGSLWNVCLPLVP